MACLGTLGSLALTYALLHLYEFWTGQLLPPGGF